MKNTPLSSVMTIDVITVKPLENMSRVAEIFNTNNIHHLPVVDDQRKVVGIISQSDHLSLCSSFTKFRPEAEGRRNERLFKSLLAQDVMTQSVASLRAIDTIDLALGFFRENLFHAIPIVNDEKKLLGIVTPMDILNFVFANQQLLQSAQ